MMGPDTACRARAEVTSPSRERPEKGIYKEAKPEKTASTASVMVHINGTTAVRQMILELEQV
jgi:hypothetical protein